MRKLHARRNKLLKYQFLTSILSFIIVTIVVSLLCSIGYGLFYGVITLFVVRTIIAREIYREDQIIFLEKRR